MGKAPNGGRKTETHHVPKMLQVTQESVPDSLNIVAEASPTCPQDFLTRVPALHLHIGVRPFQA